MRKGWGISRQEEAIEQVVGEYFGIEEAIRQKSKYSHYSIKDFLKIFADGRSFIELEKSELKEVFQEIAVRLSEVLNIKVPEVGIYTFKPKERVFGLSYADGQIELFCKLDKSQVNEKNYNRIGFLFLAYFFHEMRHHYQYCKMEQYFESVISNKPITLDVGMDACVKVDFIKECYNAMDADADLIYHLDPNEKDADYFALTLMLTLSKEYPQFRRGIYEGIVDLSNFFLLSDYSKKVDIIESEIKMIKYYQKNFMKDFRFEAYASYANLVNNFDEDAFRKLRHKQKAYAENFLRSYVDMRYNEVMHQDDLVEYRTYFQLLRDNLDTYEMCQGLRLLKIYDYDMFDANRDFVNKNFHKVEIIQENESKKRKDLNFDIEDSGIQY